MRVIQSGKATRPRTWASIEARSVTPSVKASRWAIILPASRTLRILPPAILVVPPPSRNFSTTRTLAPAPPRLRGGGRPCPAIADHDEVKGIGLLLTAHALPQTI